MDVTKVWLWCGWLWSGNRCLQCVVEDSFRSEDTEGQGRATFGHAIKRSRKNMARGLKTTSLSDHRKGERQGAPGSMLLHGESMHKQQRWGGEGWGESRGKKVVGHFHFMLSHFAKAQEWNASLWTTLRQLHTPQEMPGKEFFPPAPLSNLEWLSPLWLFPATRRKPFSWERLGRAVQSELFGRQEAWVQA